jgi:hypothetical protein
MQNHRVLLVLFDYSPRKASQKWKVLTRRRKKTMGRERVWLRQKAFDDQLLSFFRGRGLAWLKQRQYCLGMDYMLRSLNVKPTCSANLLLAKAGGTVLGEKDLVVKCDEALQRQYTRYGVTTPLELLTRSKLSDQQNADVLLVLAESGIRSHASSSETTAPLVESLTVHERQGNASVTKEALQSAVDEAVISSQGPLNENAKRVLMLEPSGSTFGRGLFADKRVPQGSVILTDTMIAGRRMRGDSCAHCLGSLSRQGSVLQTPIHCAHCEESYCSESCRDAAWKQYHQCSCKAVNPLYAQWEENMEAVLQGDVSSNAEDAGSDAKAALNCLMVGKLLCMSTIAQVHPLELPGIAHLRGFVEYEARSCLANIGAVAVTLSEALRQPNLFIEEVLTLLAMVQTNENVVQQGLTLYPILSLLNHSCTPNCIVAGPTLRQQQLVATKDIRAGEQLFIDYNPRLTGSLNFEQRRELFQQRNFECFCSRCILKK